MKLHLVKNSEEKKFYLQKRVFISEELHENSEDDFVEIEGEQINCVEAYSWLEAKKKFGYTLSPQQEILLEAERAERESRKRT